MEVHRETIFAAISAAIKDKEMYERTILRYTTDSAYLATLRDLYKALKNNEEIIVKGKIC